MPFAVDEDRMITDPSKAKPGVQPLASLDPANPPTKQIPHMEFPRVLYKHPKEAYKKVEHRNAQHEVVHVELVPAEHLTKVVADKKEMDAAIKQGWVIQPFIAPPPPDPNENLYSE